MSNINNTRSDSALLIKVLLEIAMGIEARLKAGGNPQVEIMVPLVATKEELDLVERMIREEVEAVLERRVRHGQRTPDEAVGLFVLALRHAQGRDVEQEDGRDEPEDGGLAEEDGPSVAALHVGAPVLLELAEGEAVGPAQRLIQRAELVMDHLHRELRWPQEKLYELANCLMDSAVKAQRMSKGEIKRVLQSIALEDVTEPTRAWLAGTFE